jgi:lipopolysaccharide/colanic/teichoic acid biosynthesis glycosyltransferase
MGGPVSNVPRPSDPSDPAIPPSRDGATEGALARKAEAVGARLDEALRDAAAAPVAATPAEEPTVADVVPAREPDGPPPRRGRLRATRPEAMDAAIAARLARTSRTLHAFLIFAVAANVMVVNISDVALSRRLAGAFLAGLVFLLAFRLERRNETFARLSGFAQTVYRTRAVLSGVVALAAIGYFWPWVALSPRRILTAAVLLVLVGSGWSWLTRTLLGGRRIHRTLVVGDGERVARFLSDFAADPHPDYAIAGVVTETHSGENADVDDQTRLGELLAMVAGDEGVAAAASDVPVLGTLDDLETVLAAEVIDTVVVAVRRNRLELFARLSNWDGGEIAVQELAGFTERVFGRVPVDVINAAWFMHMIHPLHRPYSRAAKRVGDVAASLAILLVALPIIPLAWLAVRLTSPGGAFYSQVRVGEGGREFRIWKIRTMRQDAEAGGAQWAQSNDPRVTSVGKFFRTTRIDEIPQLFNILRGQMSFVGPRPERPQFVAELEESVPYYRRRHMVKPGLTGWAQVRHGYADSIDAAADKLGYELYYLKHQSLFLDFVIFVETIRVVLLRFGSR